jgi:phosphatidylinositol phospholipase C beta
MDALTAPRAFRKTESMSQNKMRGLGIEENDSKNNMDSKNNIASHHHEPAKPRGKLQDAEIVN